PGATVASSPAAASTGMPNQEEMMEMAKPNENHKLLASLDGTWSFKVKFWPNGEASGNPQESAGTAVRKTIMGGRYSMMDVTGKMAMPGPEGKMRTVEFKGHGMEG